MRVNDFTTEIHNQAFQGDSLFPGEISGIPISVMTPPTYNEATSDDAIATSQRFDSGVIRGELPPAYDIAIANQEHKLNNRLHNQPDIVSSTNQTGNTDCNNSFETDNNSSSHPDTSRDSDVISNSGSNCNSDTVRTDQTILINSIQHHDGNTEL
jgi:hypothetical protein